MNCFPYFRLDGTNAVGDDDIGTGDVEISRTRSDILEGTAIGVGVNNDLVDGSDSSEVIQSAEYR